jgi:ribosome-associated toxin RatA of RatAB toxin-antitoxin module
LHGQAAEVLAAPIDQCFALLADVHQYPSWYPEVVRSVEVLDRTASGEPTRARTELHVSAGPLTKDFDLVMAVEVEPPTTVRLTKVPDDSSEQRFEVIWRLRNGKTTRIEIDLSANLRLPRFLPLGSIGDSLAAGFVAAASRAIAPGTRS